MTGQFPQDNQKHQENGHTGFGCQEDVGPRERTTTDHVNRSSVKIIALDSKINGNQYPLTIYYPVPSHLKKWFRALLSK